MSGRGAHVILRADTNGHARKRKGPLEVYPHERFFVMTGDHLQGTPATVEHRQAELDEILQRFLPVTEERNGTASRPPIHLDIGDEELLAKARNARNGARFSQLYDRGNTDAYNGDDSAADQALCNRLAFWTGGDPAWIDRLFRSSAPTRPSGTSGEARQPMGN